MLLVETQNVNIVSRGKRVFIEGIFLSGNKTNANGRWYDTRILQAALDKVQNQIRAGSFLGELGHGESQSPQLDRCSHVVESIQRSGDNFIGRARLINAGA